MKKLILFLFILGSCTQPRLMTVEQQFASAVTNDSTSFAYLSYNGDTAFINTEYYARDGEQSALVDVNEIIINNVFVVPDSGKWWYIPFTKGQAPARLTNGCSGEVTCYCDPASKNCVKHSGKNIHTCYPGGKNPCPDICLGGVDFMATHYGAGLILWSEVVVFNLVEYR